MQKKEKIRKRKRRMTCKCKKSMIGIKFNLRFDKSLMMHYCTYCGRLYHITENGQAIWRESLKSMHPNLVNRANIREVLEKNYPKEKNPLIIY